MGKWSYIWAKRLMHFQDEPSEQVDSVVILYSQEDKSEECILYPNDTLWVSGPLLIPSHIIRSAEVFRQLHLGVDRLPLPEGWEWCPWGNAKAKHLNSGKLVYCDGGGLNIYRGDGGNCATIPVVEAVIDAWKKKFPEEPSSD